MTEDSLGTILAEKITASIGTWAFIGAQALLMTCWFVLNTLQFIHALHFDPYPFTFLNLALSAEAGFATPVIMLGAKRQETHGQKVLQALLDTVTHVSQVEERLALQADEHDQHLQHQLTALTLLLQEKPEPAQDNSPLSPQIT